MWKFRRIGDYYELLDGEDTLYLCKRLDSIMVATLEDLCNRHNKEVGNTETDLLSLEDAYNNGYEDGKEEGYDLGYKRGLADALGKDEIE